MKKLIVTMLLTLMTSVAFTQSKLDQIQLECEEKSLIELKKERAEIEPMPDTYHQEKVTVVSSSLTDIVELESGYQVSGEVVFSIWFSVTYSDGHIHQNSFEAVYSIEATVKEMLGGFVVSDMKIKRQS